MTYNIVAPIVYVYYSVGHSVVGQCPTLAFRQRFGLKQ